MSELKPCPFCGQSDDLGEVKYRKNYGFDRPYPYDSCVENLPVCVGCDDEEVCNPVITKRMSCSYCGVVVSDIEIWNTRPIEDALRAENERLRSLLRTVCNNGLELGYCEESFCLDCSNSEFSKKGR